MHELAGGKLVGEDDVTVTHGIDAKKQWPGKEQMNEWWCEGMIGRE